jgi:hypothetical protein
VSLLVLVGQSSLLSQGCLAEVLDPAVLAEEGGGQAEGKPELEWETVNSGR